jgi:nucleotide-binding universal stress UspA family protein
MPRKFTDSIVVPVADASDAEATVDRLEQYSFGDLTVVHVVEKGGGVPDKTPVEQSEDVAAEAYAVVRETFPDADTRTAYGRDVVRAIVDVADDVDASAIVFRPRGGARILQFLAGDRSLRLITQADRPVVALPETDDS